METDKIIKLIDFWKSTIKSEALQSRKILKDIKTSKKEIVDVIGPRRVGKSSLLKLLIKQFKAEDFCLFINFEDPFFIENNEAKILEDLIGVFLEYFNPRLKYLVFDEIQNIKHWEKTLRKLSESHKYEIFITGSSSKLLSRELSSLLTGRHRSYQILPLDFEEYLGFKNIKIKSKKDLVLRKLLIQKHLKDYITYGGFPQQVLHKEPEVLKQYYADIVERDILTRYDVREKEILQKLGIFLITNSAKTVSMASLKKTFNISYELASNYLEYFKEAFLIFDLPLFAYSLKTQRKALKKIYSIDTGLANVVSFRFSEDQGRLIENMVFLELKRRYEEIYYYKTSQGLEVDFITVQKSKKELIQVCSDLDNPETKKREIRSLLEASKELKCKNLKVLTLDYAQTEKHKGKSIDFIPLWKWLLDRKDGHLGLLG